MNSYYTKKGSTKTNLIFVFCVTLLFFFFSGDPLQAAPTQQSTTELFGILKDIKNRQQEATRSIKEIVKKIDDVNTKIDEKNDQISELSGSIKTETKIIKQKKLAAERLLLNAQWLKMNIELLDSRMSIYKQHLSDYRKLSKHFNTSSNPEEVAVEVQRKGERIKQLGTSIYNNTEKICSWAQTNINLQHECNSLKQALNALQTKKNALPQITRDTATGKIITPVMQNIEKQISNLENKAMLAQVHRKNLKTITEELEATILAGRIAHLDPSIHGPFDADDLNIPSIDYSDIDNTGRITTGIRDSNEIIMDFPGSEIKQDLDTLTNSDSVGPNCKALPDFCNN